MAEYSVGKSYDAHEVRVLRERKGVSIEEAKEILDGEALSREVAKAETVEDLKYVLQALIDKNYRSRDL